MADCKLVTMWGNGHQAHKSVETGLTHTTNLRLKLLLGELSCSCGEHSCTLASSAAAGRGQLQVGKLSSAATRRAQLGELSCSGRAQLQLAGLSCSCCELSCSWGAQLQLSELQLGELHEWQ